MTTKEIEQMWEKGYIRGMDKYAAKEGRLMAKWLADRDGVLPVDYSPFDVEQPYKSY